VWEKKKINMKIKMKITINTYTQILNTISLPNKKVSKFVLVVWDTRFPSKRNNYNNNNNNNNNESSDAVVSTPTLFSWVPRFKSGLEGRPSLLSICTSLQSSVSSHVISDINMALVHVFALCGNAINRAALLKSQPRHCTSADRTSSCCERAHIKNSHF
jgi:hypothetical protein